MAGWTVEFYADDRGREPLRKWLERDLKATQRDALLAALEHILQRFGPDVCRSEWGKALGGGLYELRIRHSAAEIERMLGGTQVAAGKGQDVLLRVFFHVYGQRIVLLLGGYDKGRYPSPKRQQREIEVARSRLRDFQARQRAAKPKGVKRKRP